MRRLVPARLSSDYGMALVLVLLCVYYSWTTYTEQHPNGLGGARALASWLEGRFPAGTTVLVVGRDHPDDAMFVDGLDELLRHGNWRVVGRVKGQPAEARAVLERLVAAGEAPAVVACNQVSGAWALFADFRRLFPALTATEVVRPPSYRWPNFLKVDNLLNVANQIVVIAILAIGMTFVIVAGGIDLSVGSLIALAAVTATLLIREVAGAEQASAWGMLLCGAAAVALCGGLGIGSGVLVTGFGIPPFIVTLAMMLVSSGLAFILAQGQSVYQVPDSFVGLGRGATLGLPNAVWLMALLYLLAHVLMTRTVLGRHIYAVGGNAEASRLSGVPVRRVRVFTYAASGALAGLGGVVMASQLKSGSPTYGQMYELYVIAAVVVGGTSLAGGQGKILGTLVGALIIAVIQNGMNLTGVQSYTQKVVLGLVILSAVLLDMLKRRGLRFWRNA
ncbi:MAG: ABC transporter permease [Verrucomicrobia bacterium]|nr:ABC transporter permease [Verrucomicrobiota bacterium]